jgi:hypothetical protein
VKIDPLDSWREQRRKVSLVSSKVVEEIKRLVEAEAAKV